MEGIPDLLVERNIKYKKKKRKKGASKLFTAKRRNRRNETYEECLARLEKQRVQSTLARLKETPEQRYARLEYSRWRRSLSIRNESDEKREARLERDRKYSANVRLNEDPDKREARLERDRNYKANARHNEDPEKRRIRLERLRLSVAQRRSNEDPEARRLRLERARIAVAERRKNEDPETRKARLERNRISKARLRAKEKMNENPDKRKTPLKNGRGHIADNRKNRQEQNFLHVPTVNTSEDLQELKALQHSNLQTLDRIFMEVVVPDYKPSQEYLENMKHSFNLENNYNISCEESRFDEIHREYNEVIGPKSINSDVIQASDETTLQDTVKTEPQNKVHDANIKKETEMIVTDIYFSDNEHDDPKLYDNLIESKTTMMSIIETYSVKDVKHEFSESEIDQIDNQLLLNNELLED